MGMSNAQMVILIALPLLAIASNVALSLYVVNRIDNLSDKVGALTERVTRLEEKVISLIERVTKLEGLSRLVIPGR